MFSWRRWECLDSCRRSYTGGKFERDPLDHLPNFLQVMSPTQRPYSTSLPLTTPNGGPRHPLYWLAHCGHFVISYAVHICHISSDHITCCWSNRSNHSFHDPTIERPWKEKFHVSTVHCLSYWSGKVSLCQDSHWPDLMFFILFSNRLHLHISYCHLYIEIVW